MCTTQVWNQAFIVILAGGMGNEEPRNGDSERPGDLSKQHGSNQLPARCYYRNIECYEYNVLGRGCTLAAAGLHFANEQGKWPRTDLEEVA
jgi:hypothetical protein